MLSPGSSPESAASGISAASVREARVESYHTAAITPEQAANINNGVSIELYGIIHGNYTEPLRNAEQLDVEYQSAADVVARLDPTRGDTLFVEAARHDGGLADWSFLYNSYDNESDKLAALEAARQDRVFTPVDYGIERAKIKGIPVVPADIHQEIYNEFMRITGQSPDTIWQQENPFMQMFHQLREEQAANTVKDYALTHAPWVQAEKPIYAVMWGKGHMDDSLDAGMQGAFERLGLQIKVEFMPDAERFRELAKIAWYLRTLPLMAAAPEQLRQTQDEFAGFPVGYLGMVDPSRPGYRASEGRRALREGNDPPPVSGF